MESWLRSAVAGLPEAWVLLVQSGYLLLTVMAWAFPTWRGNALSAVFGFAASFGGIWAARWAVRHPPIGCAWVLKRLEIEAPQTPWLDFRPHMGLMFFTLVGGGLAYVLGMAVAKFFLRIWILLTGSTITENERDDVLNPYR